ncbi:hypothetical protein Q5752_002303 [Cryptotrichosporon argae]
MTDMRPAPRQVSFGAVRTADVFAPSSPCPAPVPLGPAKLIASRKGVAFSPRNETKLFKATEAICDSPAASVRAYPDSSPPSSSRTQPGPLSTPARPILKAREYAIRVAATVEEGTMSNKEPARLLVTGLRPRAVARDSFQLAQLRTAARDAPTAGTGSDEVPSSDDSAGDASDPALPQEPQSEVSEQEEEVESLPITSLVGVLLDGAEDLLTLEEAYTTLTGHLREVVPAGPTNSPAGEANVREAVQPIKDEAPAVVRAIQRDLHRLMGKMPSSEQTAPESSPFRNLMPYREVATPTPRGRMSPSSTPTPEQSARQGYTEAEVRYRREAAGVGAAALRFLAFAFQSPQIHGCFSDVDLQALLDQIMVIPRTPRLPTPNPKRTYYLAILVLSSLKVPGASVQPVKDKIVRAVESSLVDNPSMVGMAAGQIRKEAFSAIANLVATYPNIFFPHYNDWLPSCLRALASPTPAIRSRASAAVAAFAAVKLRVIAKAEDQAAKPDATLRDHWINAKTAVNKLEVFVSSHFKSPYASSKGTYYDRTGERRTEWNALEKTFRETIGSQNHVAWACATWAVVATLLGQAYNATPIAAGMNHIIDPSKNLIRPTLGAIAWQHAIHAYLSANSTAFIVDDRVAHSWTPFIASAHQDVADRLRTIQLPVDLALRQAIDPQNVSRVHVPMAEFDGETRWKWERTENWKSLSWMASCGTTAAAVVYAYSGIALKHEDAPAKEVSAVTGLPSSDGFVVEPTAECGLPRLDSTFEKVVLPMLKSFFGIQGVDSLKTHGWKIMEAITSARDVTFNLDRLLSPRYLSGEVFDSCNASDLVQLVERERIQPSQIPGWGTLWVAKRLGTLLLLFDEALEGIRGVSDLNEIEWVADDNGIVLLPVTLSNIWSNLLTALASIPNTATPLYMAGLQAVVRHLVGVFERDPTSYVPICLLKKDGTTNLPVDTIRLSITAHLYARASEILGGALGTVRISPELVQHARDTQIATLAFGADNGATAAGALLGQLLRTTLLSSPVQPATRIAFRRLIGSILDVGAVNGFSGKLLGDLTNQIPWIFETQEEYQLDVWRLLALKWTAVIDLQPSTSSTNHTGALLVSLLSHPFRGRQVTSVWHQSATQEDLAAWRALLEVAVLRFRARKAGSNVGVLDALAGHLADYLEAGPKTSSTTITLSCLAAAIAWIAFVPTEHHHASHFTLNENYVPVDFLSLVGDALVEAYPQQTDSVLPAAQVISPAVGDVLDNLAGAVKSLPLEFVMPVLEPVQSALALWMADAAEVASELCASLDTLYMTLLDALAGAIGAGHIPASSDTVNSLIELYAPRLSRAQSEDVPTAFQAFWARTFQDVRGVDFSDDVAGFLGDVMAAVPGMISAHGLAGGESWSEQESHARFPRAYTLRAEPKPIVEDVEVAAESASEAEAEAEVSEPVPTAAYDADVSTADAPASPSSSALVSETDSEEQASGEKASTTDDVFGPARPSRGKPRGRKRGSQVAASQRTKRARLAEPVDAEADVSRVPETPAAELDDCIIVASSHRAGSDEATPAPAEHGGNHAQRPSVFRSATRWLARVPSFGAIFSPVRTDGSDDDTPAPPHAEAPTPASAAAPRAQSPSSTPGPALRKPRRSKRRELERTQSEYDLVAVPRLTRSASLRGECAPITPAAGERKRRRTSEAPSEAGAASAGGEAPRRGRGKGKERAEPVPEPHEGDDDDELILSPETAKRTRVEEEGAIAEIASAQAEAEAAEAEAAAVHATAELPSGVFDDAPGDITLPSTAAAGSPTRRTAVQTRVLDMLAQSARYRAAVESLAFDDVMELLKHVETVRAAATANLARRAEDERAARRAARRSASRGA